MANSYQITTFMSNGEKFTSNPIPLNDQELNSINTQVKSGRAGSVQEVILANVVKSLEDQDKKISGESTPAWFNLGDCESRGEGVACTVNAKYVVSMEVKYIEGP